MTLGSITFGPTKTAAETALWRQQMAAMQTATGRADTSVQACNCLGPQAGETKCPCALRAELAKADQMLREGVVIFGRKYRLVPETAA